MTAGEHLDPDDGWQRHEWLEAWDDVDPGDYGLRRVRDLRTAPGLLDEPERLDGPGLMRLMGETFDRLVLDELRPADFDDEERRP